MRLHSSTTVLTDLVISRIHYGNYRWFIVKVPFLMYTSRICIRIASTKLRINYLPETLHLLSYWGGILIQQCCPNIRVFRLRVGWWRIEYMEVCSSSIGDQGMYGRENIFMPSVTTRVKPLQWFVVLVVSYLVDFLINHRHPLVINGASLINIYCTPWIFHQKKLEPQRYI